MAATVLALALAACDDGAESGAADGRTAEGEVLGGTISDEMLPLDTVRSQPPPLRVEPSGEGDEDVPAETGEAPDEQEPAETDNTEDTDANAGALPQIQLNPAPDPAAPTSSEGEGDQVANP